MSKDSGVERSIIMSESEIRLLVQQSVTVTLTSLGITHNDPNAMQRDFQYLRDSRETSEAVKKKAWLTLIGTFIVGIISLVTMGLKEYFKN